jgi:hypothetical protein
MHWPVYVIRPVDQENCANVSQGVQWQDWQLVSLERKWCV